MTTATIDTRLPDRVMTRVQWRLLPLLFLAYLVAYIDRSNISFAAATMNADLGFTATIYGLAGGLFFLSYALLEVPSNLAMARFGARTWIARIMVTWGIVSAATMFVQTPMQFYVMRFLLGAAEAGFFPAIIYYVSLWFPERWRGRAVGRFYVALPVATAVMGLISAPILDLDGRLGLQGWQWLFLLEGVPAVILGVIVYRQLTDTPAEARWLADEERRWLTGALAEDAARNPAADHGSLMEAVTDRTTLLFGLVWACIVAVNTILALSIPQILGAKTGVDPAGAGRVLMVAGVIGALTLLANAWSSDRRRERYRHMIIPMLVQALAIGGMAFATTPALVIGCYLVNFMASMATQPVFFAALSESLNRRHVAIGTAAVNTLAQVAGFIAPILFGMSKDATGNYDLGLAIMPVFLVVAAGLSLHLGRRWQTARVTVTLPA
jgi:ACS family tartrate transporter-like MFS transporter